MSIWFLLSYLLPRTQASQILTVSATPNCNAVSLQPDRIAGVLLFKKLFVVLCLDPSLSPTLG